MKSHLINMKYKPLVDILSKLDVLGTDAIEEPRFQFKLSLGEIWLDDFTPTEHRPKTMIIYWI